MQLKRPPLRCHKNFDMKRPVYDTNYPDHLTQITQQLGNGTVVTNIDSMGRITGVRGPTR